MASSERLGGAGDAAFMLTVDELDAWLGGELPDPDGLLALRRAEYARDCARPDPPATFVGSPPPFVPREELSGDRFVGVVRRGHPLARGRMTPARYTAGRHIQVSRRGLDKGPIDDALKKAGLERQVVTIVGGFAAALALARTTDLIASVPERHTGNMRDGLRSFALPVATTSITVSMLWHPRLDADPAHRWLRGVVRDICRTA